MCGLVGMYRGENAKSLAGDKFDSIKSMAHHLLLIDSLRGEDSTGSVHVEDKGVSLNKDTCAGWQYVKGSKWSSQRNRIDFFQAWLGHNRSATTGGKTYEAAHPHRVGNIVLMHNGTLEGNWRNALPVTTPNDVDSARLAAGIDKWGITETLENVQGAYALTYLDLSNKEVQIVRNDKRTLFFAYQPDINALWWASESAFLQFSAFRSGSELAWIASVPEMSLFRFKLDGKVEFPEEANKADDFLKTISTKVSGWKHRPLVQVGYNTHYQKGNYTNNTGKATKVTTNNPASNDLTPASKENEATFLKKFGLQKGNTIRCTVKQYEEYVTIKNAQPCYSGKGFLVAEFNGRFKEVVAPVIILSFPVTKTRDNGFRELTSFISQITGTMWYRHPDTGTQEYVLTVSPKITSPEYRSKGTFVGYGGEALTYDEIKNLLSQGCAICQNELEPDGDDDIRWPWPDIPVCGQCYDASPALIADTTMVVAATTTGDTEDAA